MPEKSKITLTIDGTPITVDQGTTIMEAAEELGVHVPRLCYHPDLSLAGSCRVCIVDVTDVPFFMAACSVQVWEGMEVKTHSPEIRQARRDIVELLLDNHPKDCQTCERDGNCELQNLAYSLGVRERLFEGTRTEPATDASSQSVIRVPQKCILCGRCVRVCHETQGVSNLSQQGRGFTTVVAPAHNADMDASVCIQCGQCINVCPTAAFIEQRHTERVFDALADPEKHVVVQIAPSIRAAIGEGFGNPPGTPETGRTVTALRRLGFDVVFDTNFGADLTICEEAHELAGRLKSGGPLPIITSCSPGWINFLERFYPELIENASSCKSPMSMLSTLIKTFYAEKQGIDPEKIYSVAVMPCVAKKFEMARPMHMFHDDVPYTDAVLTTRELIWMIKCFGINFNELDDGEFDVPLGLSSGAGDIFGCTGGVMEATLRAASTMLTDEPVERMEFTEVRAVEGLREQYIAIGDRNIRVGVANGLTNAKTLLDKILAGEQYHAVEVMACPGGCIGGGGQPYPPAGGNFFDPELFQLRSEALYTIDQKKTWRRSLENEAVRELYEEFLGDPGSEKAHQLLHTHYYPRLPRGIR